MTVSTCFFKNAAHSIGSSFFDQKLSDRANRLMSLFKGMLPISNETVDHQGNLSRLWVLKNGMFLGIVFHSDGKISFIPSNKVINSCNNKPISLENLKGLQDLQIDLAYISEQKKFVIFPHLRAAGDDQKIAQVAAKSLNPKPPASWTPPSLDTRSERLGHIFTGDIGHFSEDTAENRTYFLSAVSDPANKKAVNKFGKEMYAKVMPDGHLAWAHVRNGLVTNGGRGSPWYVWVADNNPKGAGGSMKPRPPYSSDKFTFQEKVQADHLTEVYNKSIRNNPWTPHPTESKSAARDVGEIHHQAGIIMEAQFQNKKVDLLSKHPDFSLLEMIENSSTKEKESWCSLM